ncbi:hypothetical protein F444_16591 [Phytophthora nicotianae P1976]|uniref:Uncharacterized protein n=2 Tax=Phytophthora nicotianae TaxID=4792 RepID=A0A080ZHQ0_PHYNI|nr:hypothetical protein F444_16591 [Phytophthora nicotianae P1976]
MAVVKLKSKDHVELIEDIRHHRQEAPLHGNLVTVEISAAYRAFCEQQEQKYCATVEFE